LLIDTDDEDLMADPRWELLAAAGVRVINGRTRELVVEADRLTGVRTRDDCVIAADVVYVSPPIATGDSLLPALGATTTTTPSGPATPSTHPHRSSTPPAPATAPANQSSAAY
jgi:hypothetical protein